MKGRSLHEERIYLLIIASRDSPSMSVYCWHSLRCIIREAAIHTYSLTSAGEALCTEIYLTRINLTLGHAGCLKPWNEAYYNLLFLYSLRTGACFSSLQSTAFSLQTASHKQAAGPEPHLGNPPFTAGFLGPCLYCRPTGTSLSELVGPLLYCRSTWILILRFYLRDCNITSGLLGPWLYCTITVTCNFVMLLKWHSH